MADKTRGSIRGRTRVVSEAAKSLRKEMTHAERLLWGAIRAGRLDGLKFRRQHAVGRCILDFYCPAAHLALEVDGAIHDEQAEHDQLRTDLLSSYGIKVIRFRNEDVCKNLASVIERIEAAANQRFDSEESDENIAEFD